ncbi:MAG: energy transducer TonB [Acidobacteriota bacterium]
MFNNLIESSSHVDEMKRRGSFFLFTVVTYVVLFVAAGVASIYAYDAQLEYPNTEMITMLNPVDFPKPEPAPSKPTTGPSVGSGHSSGFVRRNPTASVNDPQVVPTETSSTPSTNPILPAGVPFTVGNHDANPGIPGAGRHGGGGSGNNTGGTTPVIDVGSPPKPEPVQKTVPKIISKGPITGEAISLPKPAYPPLAKQMRIQGRVSVQVLIDEAGRVISAKAIDGSPALMHAAQKAAFEARFSPTRLSGQPVKVSGVITYNFVLQ